MGNRSDVRKAKAILALVGWCAILLMVAGCASSPAQTQDAQSKSPAPAAAEMPSPEPEPQTSGLVISTADTNAEGNGAAPVRVELVNPETLASTTLIDRPESSGLTLAFWPAMRLALRGWSARQLLSPSLDRMAVQWRDPEDGSSHVGWVDADGALTDVSQRLASGSSDFAAAPQHVNPLFDAKGHFVYVDSVDSTLHTLDSSSLAETGKVKKGYSAAWFEPDGSVDANPPSRQPVDILYGMPGGYLLAADDIMDVVSDTEAVLLVENRLKITGPAYERVSTANSDRKYHALDRNKVPAITPVSDWRIETASVAPDKRRVAFVATRGQERSVFVVQIDGKAQPQKIMDFRTDQSLWFWR